MFDFMRDHINTRSCRSAWEKGVRMYALELVDSLEETAANEKHTPYDEDQLRDWMLNGAANWAQYSAGGLSLVYNHQIAERLCTASELKRTNNGMKNPNTRETWIDCQTRALYQAAIKVCNAYRIASWVLEENV